MSNRPDYTREDVLREADELTECREFTEQPRSYACKSCGEGRGAHWAANKLRDYAALQAS